MEKPPAPTTIELLNRARSDARNTGTESSAYFLDKCGAEAGDFDEPESLEQETKGHGMTSFVSVLLRDEERSRTVLAVAAAVGGLAAIGLAIAASLLTRT